MIMSRNLLSLFSATVALGGAAVAQCSNYTLSPAGTVLIDADDAIYNVALPFPFPFNGAIYNSITVSTNGWIKLGPATATSSQTGDTEALMLSDDPRIAVCWDDLNPSSTSGSGALYYSADASQASVTWQGVQRFGASQVGTLANCECILLPTGDIYLNYDASCTFNLSNSSSIVGISAGGSQVVAGTNLVDWSAASPGPIAVVDATAYELFAAGAFDLAGTGVVLHFAPTGADTYDVTQVPTLPACIPAGFYPGLASGPQSIGTGCPPPVPNGSIYELFTTDTGASPIDTQNSSILFSRSGETYFTLPGAGIDPTYLSGTVVPLGDEQFASLSVGAMGFFPFGDLLVSDLNLSSNGFIALDSSIPTPDFSPTAAEFNNEGPRIAGCWKDLNPSSAGTIYYNNTNPNYCMVTFDAVVEFGTTSTGSLCTFQMKLFASGDIEISHGAVSSVTDNIIVGISRGAAVDPGSSDLVTGGVVNFLGPVDIVGQSSMTHTTSTFAIGKSFDMFASLPSSSLGFFTIGTSTPNLPLDSLGGIGCTAYASLDFVFLAPFSGSNMSFSLPQIPYNPAYSGQQFYTQAAAFSSVNSLGIVTSNGMSHVLGL
jgi:hypothetical protein